MLPAIPTPSRTSHEAEMRRIATWSSTIFASAVVYKPDLRGYMLGTGVYSGVSWIIR